MNSSKRSSPKKNTTRPRPYFPLVKYMDEPLPAKPISVNPPRVMPLVASRSSPRSSPRSSSPRSSPRFSPRTSPRKSPRKIMKTRTQTGAKMKKVVKKYNKDPSIEVGSAFDAHRF